MGELIGIAFLCLMAYGLFLTVAEFLLKVFAFLGSESAQNKLGKEYDSSGQQDLAVKWHLCAAKNLNADSKKYVENAFWSGKAKGKNLKEILNWYQILGERGDDGAQAALGYAYWKGLGVSQDYTESIRWYQKSADNGNKVSRKVLGDAYRTGIGIEKNIEKAIELYRKSAEQGFVDAQVELGSLYYYGKEVNKDLTQALKWSAKAAEQDNPKAQLILAYIYSAPPYNDLDKAFSCIVGALLDGYVLAQSFAGDIFYYQKKYKQFVNWHKTAAEQGNIYSGRRLAEAYEKGVGTAKDLSESFNWYLKSARAGDSVSQRKIGDFYREGVVIPRDDGEALQWYKKAAERGDALANYWIGCHYEERGDYQTAFLYYKVSADDNCAPAQFSVYQLYYNGLGVNQDLNKALGYLERSARNGTFRAQYALGMIYKTGELVKQSDAMALEWLNKAAQVGSIEALLKLSEWYESGNGVKKDLELAGNYLRKAVRLGSEQAKIRLQKFGRIKSKNQNQVRNICLDTETTGLSWKNGDKICEIAAVEFDENYEVVSYFHSYINPDRLVPREAVRIHGLTNAFLSDKPKFKNVAAEFLNYVAGANIYIHNAPFDKGFINNELQKLGLKTLEVSGCKIHCTLKMSRDLGNYPNKLDDLCIRYGINNQNRIREKGHGALKDSLYLISILEKLQNEGNGFLHEAAVIPSDIDNSYPKPKVKLKKTHIEKLRESAEYGDLDSQIELGVIYETGKGVPKDYSKAVDWYLRAAKQKSDKAILKVVNLTIDNNLDPSKCLDLISEVADQENLKAQCWLASMYKCGLGSIIPKDPDVAFWWYMRAAQQGDSQSQFIVGENYEKGETVEEDLDEACEWYKRAAKQGNFEAQKRIADILFQNGDYKEALFWLEQVADSGDADAQFKLGELFHRGQIVDYDFKNAEKWYLAAEKNGHASAAYKLGNLYEESSDSPKGYSVALSFYKKAAENGSPEALYKLGQFYLRGLGTDKDDSEALKYFWKAANAGCHSAFFSLALCYEKGISVKRNVSKSIDLYKKSINDQDSSAEIKLGDIYKNGQDVDQNYGEARRWYVRALKKGNSVADDRLNSLDDMVRRGEIKAIDHLVLHDPLVGGISETFENILRAADHGDPNGQYTLGLLYRFGDSVEQDYSVSMLWLRRAAEQNHALAQYALGEVYENGLGTQQDGAQAVEWYTRASSNNYYPAMTKLADIYAHGILAKQDYQVSEKWYRRAVELGSIEAKPKLQKLLDKIKDLPAKPKPSSFDFHLCGDIKMPPPRYERGDVEFQKFGSEYFDALKRKSSGDNIPAPDNEEQF